MQPPIHRMRQWMAALGLLVFLFPAVVAARCDSSADCLHLIEAAQKDTRTITASFTQSKQLTLLEEPLVSTGRFVFKRPDRILWAIDKPQPTSVIVNGSEVSVPDLPESERRALAAAPMVQMLRELGGVFTGAMEQVQEAFEVDARQEGPAIDVKLVPRRAADKKLFRTIEVQFVGPDLLVKEIRLEDGLGDRLRVTFDHVRRNADVADSTFEASVSR